MNRTQNSVWTMSVRHSVRSSVCPSVHPSVFPSVHLRIKETCQNGRCQTIYGGSNMIFRINLHWKIGLDPWNTHTRSLCIGVSQGGIKCFTSWEPGFQIWDFLRNSVKSSNTKPYFVVTVKPISKVKVWNFDKMAKKTYKLGLSSAKLTLVAPVKPISKVKVWNFGKMAKET